MKIDVEEINKKITDDSIKDIMKSFGAYPISETSEYILFPSICHHIDFDNHKKKLYYYKNGSFFLCYSCSSSGDIYWLVQERKKLLGEECNFPQAIKYVCDILGIDCDNIEPPKPKTNIYDWSGLKKYLKNASSLSVNKEYDKSILNYFDETYHDSFINDHISIETMEKFGIRFYKYKQQICIPVYDENSRFIGIHARNLLPELIEQGYKYIPLKMLNGVEYKFNTSNVLFGLNMNKMFIKTQKTVIITEAPKGVMQLDSYGVHIGVGLFGRNLQKAKLKLLLQYGIENVIIALDKQYHSILDESGEYTSEYIKYEKVVMKIIDSFRPYVKNIYVVYDKDEDNYLDYCDSPMDKGKYVWKKMLEDKENIL